MLESYAVWLFAHSNIAPRESLALRMLNPDLFTNYFELTYTDFATFGKAPPARYVGLEDADVAVFGVPGTPPPRCALALDSARVRFESNPFTFTRSGIHNQRR